MTLHRCATDESLPSAAIARLVFSVVTVFMVFAALSANATAAVSQKEQAFAQFELAVRNVPLPNIDAVPKVVEFEGFISYSSPIQSDGEVPIEANVIAAPVFSRELPTVIVPEATLRAGQQNADESIWYLGSSLRGQIFHPIEFSISSDVHPAMMPEDEQEETVIRPEITYPGNPAQP